MPKPNTVVQEVEKKKNQEVLEKLRSHTFLRRRESFVTDSVDTRKDESHTIRNLKDQIAELEAKLDGSESEDKMEKRKCRVRRDLFGNIESSVQHKQLDRVDHDTAGEGELEDGSVNVSVAAKPTITNITAVKIDLRHLKKLKTNDDANKDARNPKNTRMSITDRMEGGSSNAPIPPLVVEDNALPDNNPADDHGSSDEDNPGGIQRLRLRERKRKAENVECDLRKRIHRDLEEALRYYEREDADPNARKRYEVVDNRIYLGEGIDASSTVWYLLLTNKPQIFFAGMLELLWSKHVLMNRCQTLKTVSTKLQDRSRMKELTPRKKRLAYKLYADYLDGKKIKGADKVGCLVKVPSLITTKINYLRSRKYQKGT